MTEKVKLTKRGIELMQPPASGRAFVYDEKQSNLCLCITSTGVRTWYRYGRIDGRPERIKLGRFPDVTVENARKAAAAIGGDVARGANPKRRRGKVTLADLFDYWLADARQRKRSWRADERTFAYHFAPLRHRRLSDVTTADVSRWHADIGKKRGTIIANRARALLSAMYGKARELGHDGGNPCLGVKRFRETSRERFLLSHEMPAFFVALKDEPPAWRDFWLCCLFSGARRGAVASMRWVDVDLTQGLWHLPATQSKNGRPLAVVLPPQAVEILEQRYDARTDDSPWVFPSADNGGHVVDPRKSWRRVLKASRLENLHPHDLRRSLASWQVAAGASLQVVGQSLGHTDSKSTSVYARLLTGPVRASVNGAVANMLAAAEPNEGGNRV